MRDSLDRLRAVAARFLDPRAIEHVIDPLLTDIQVEYANASRRGRVWLSRWTLVSGHVAFLKALALCTAQGVLVPFQGWFGDDLAPLKRTLGASAAAIAITTIVFELPPVLTSTYALSEPRVLLYLLPQALVVAVPLGATIGVCLGLRGRVISSRSVRAVLAGAIGLSFVCFVTLAWIMPRANQEFRQLMFRRISGDERAVLRKGFNELTLGELSDAIDADRRTGIINWNPHVLAYSYHERWALASATVVLAAFALAMMQRLVRGWMVGFCALGTVLSYYWLLSLGRDSVLHADVPAVLGAWLPNLAFALAWTLLLARNSRRAPPGTERTEDIVITQRN